MNNTKNISVKGMHCASCAFVIETTVKEMEGVKFCEVNYGSEKLKVDIDESKTSLKEINNKIIPLGYSLILKDDNTLENDQEVIKNNKLKDLKDQKIKVILSLPLALSMFVIMIWETLSKAIPSFPMFFIEETSLKYISFVLATFILFGIGNKFLKEIFVFIKYRKANMYTLVGIGTSVAYIYSTIITFIPYLQETLKLPTSVYFDVTIVVISFVYFGKYLENKSKLYTGEAIQKLLNLQAKTARIKVNGIDKEVDVNTLKVNDLVVIKPGEKVPIDGEVVEGKTYIDESMISGEPLSVEKNINSLVFGGTINQKGSIVIKVTKVGSATLLAQIVKIVDEAQATRAPIQSMADKISSIFVPLVLVIALLTLLSWLLIGPNFMPFTTAFTYGLICFVGVLVIACPCALGLATPTAIIVGTGLGAKNGILIKNAEGLEILSKIDTIVFDKTGTITKGKPDITDVVVLNKDISKEKLLLLTASIENLSEHPIANCIVESVDKNKLFKVTNFENIEGRGVRGVINNTEYFVGSPNLMKSMNISIDENIIGEMSKTGKTVILIASNKKVLGVIAIADKLKENAKATIQEFHKLSLNVVLLTGDNSNTAKYIANQVNIDKVYSEVLPVDKGNIIKEIQGNGHIVAMVGDGINDAPALASANVGIAMANGSDIAIESAQITLLRGDISKVLSSLKLSKATIRTIKQNLFWAFLYNVLCIPLAAGLFFPFFGILLNPLFAGIAMALSSLSVITNSLRLKATKLVS